MRVTVPWAQQYIAKCSTNGIPLNTLRTKCIICLYDHFRVGGLRKHLKIFN